MGIRLDDTVMHYIL